MDSCTDAPLYLNILEGVVETGETINSYLKLKLKLEHEVGEYFGWTLLNTFRNFCFLKKKRRFSMLILYFHVVIFGI